MESCPDKFGFYRVGNSKFYSKIEAIEMQEKTGTHLHWDFNELVFSTCDWKNEPFESLTDLYCRRAQQIREKYDYIVLWYSSGPDSDAALRAFLDNDILLDEVASFTNYDATHDPNDHYLNGEIYNIASVKIKQYQELYPDLKHRILDLCQPTVDFWSNKQNMFNWWYSMNTIFNPNATIRSRLSQTVTDWKKILDSGKTLAFVWGIDKPRLNIIDNCFCFQFIDCIDNAINPIWQSDPPPGEHIEFFFWSPDLPEIVIKQAHIIKKYLRSSTSQSMFMQKESTGLGYIIDNGNRYWISTVGVHSLIYPNFKYNSLNDFKPPSLFFTPRDKWFFSLPDNDIAKKNWRSSLEALWCNVPDYWKNDPQDIDRSFKLCVSRPYFLE